MSEATQEPVMNHEPDALEQPDSNHSQPIVEFREIYNKQAFIDFSQDALYEVLPHYIDDLSHFLLATVEKLRPMLHTSLASKKGVRFWVAVQVEYSHPTKELIDITPKYLNTGIRTLFHAKDIEDKLNDVVQSILLRNAHFIRDNSGLVLNNILPMHYKAAVYHPLVGRAYQELPQFLTRKGAIINVKNQDDRCFGYAVLSALNPMSNKLHPNRPGHYIHLFHQFGLHNIAYPVAIEDIPTIEDKMGVSINVFGFKDDNGKARYPLYVSEKGHEKMIELLFWDEHYAWIKNFRRFMADMSSHNTLHWCRRCMGHFDNADVLKTHHLSCRGVDSSGQVLLTPDASRKGKFENEPYAYHPVPSNFTSFCSDLYDFIPSHFMFQCF